MVTDKAKHKARVLSFWRKHGLGATVEAFGVKRHTLYHYLTHWHTYPKTPKMNAHNERFNRTIQEEFVDQHEQLLREPEQFNIQLMHYLLWYNTKRPHWGLQLQSPVDYMLSTNQLSRMRWTDTNA